MAAIAWQAAIMIGWLARLLKLDGSGYDHQADEHVQDAHAKLAELEESQTKLRRAVEETGFFLGDAYLRKTDESGRTIHHHH